MPPVPVAKSALATVASGILSDVTASVAILWVVMASSAISTVPTSPFFILSDVMASVAILWVVTAVSAISSVFTSPFAILAEVMASSAILAVVTALAAMVGSAAVPLRSPASCTIPFSAVVASGVVSVAVFIHTVPL